MIVHYSSVTGLSLRDPQDFRRFKVLVEDVGTMPGDKGLIAIDEGNVLVPVDLVPRLPGAPADAEWLSQFRAMVAAAAAHGWIDAERDAIRAHVETAQAGD